MHCRFNGKLEHDYNTKKGYKLLTLLSILFITKSNKQNIKVATQFQNSKTMIIYEVSFVVLKEVKITHYTVAP